MRQSTVKAPRPLEGAMGSASPPTQWPCGEVLWYQVEYFALEIIRIAVRFVEDLQVFWL